MYSKVNWVNGVTPLNDANLNNMDDAIAEHDNQMSFDGTALYLDFQGGKWGVNTDPARGADTFTPFNTGGSSDLKSFAYSYKTGINVSATASVKADDYIIVTYHTGNASYTANPNVSGVATELIYSSSTTAANNGVKVYKCTGTGTATISASASTTIYMATVVASSSAASTLSIE